MRALFAVVAVSIGLAVLAAGLRPGLPIDDARWHGRYDHHFKKQAKRYFGAGFDWRWFKAQGIVESHLRPHARSSRGAVGVLQILPTTFNEIWEDPAITPGITEPRWNIASGIAYSRYLYERWDNEVPDTERLAFTLASYNAGFTGIMRARQRAVAAGHDPADWTQVARYVPAETDRYVARIHSLMGAGS